MKDSKTDTSALTANGPSGQVTDQPTATAMNKDRGDEESRGTRWQSERRGWGAHEIYLAREEQSHENTTTYMHRIPAQGNSCVHQLTCLNFHLVQVAHARLAISVSNLCPTQLGVLFPHL